MEEAVSLRRARTGDIPKFLELQALSPEAARWTAADYEQKLEHDSTLSLVATMRPSGESGEEVAGFILAQRAADEVEILNLAVAPPARRRGVGARLLESALGEAVTGGARRCWLEVRASNLAAGLFYQGRGFRATYRRKNYYSNPVEDAVVYMRDLETGSRAS